MFREENGKTKSLDFSKGDFFQVKPTKIDLNRQSSFLSR